MPATDRLTSQIWFDDLQDSLILTEADRAAIAQFVFSSLLLPATTTFPESLRQDESPRIAFLSVSDGRSPAFVVWGSDRGLEKTLLGAIAQLSSRLPAEYRPQWLKVDLVQESIASVRLNSPTPLRLERSLHGLAFGRNSQIAFLPEELVAANLVDKEQVLQSDNIVAYLEADRDLAQAFQEIRANRQLQLYRFTCTSFFADGSEVVQLYRGHRLFNDFSTEAILQAARAGGEYLKRALGEDGKFVYNYRAIANTASKKYNILRHAGTIYSLLELYEVTQDEELLASARRAIAYLQTHIQPAPTYLGVGTCVVENGAVKLGGNALAAIALAKYTDVTGDEQHLPAIAQLGRWIESVRDEDGRFAVHKQFYGEAQATGFRSDYYPGEAILALTRIHALTGEKHWLDTAEAAAQYLIQVRDGGLPNEKLPQDHWLLYGLNELFRQRPNPIYLTHAGRIADAIVQHQNYTPADPDWLGSFQTPPRSNPTATRVEGLCAAYQLAQFSKNTSQLKTLLEAIVLGISFQLQTQIRPEIATYLADPARSLGGFRRSLTDFEVRIDCIQHNLSSLLGLYRISRGGDGRTPEP